LLDYVLRDGRVLLVARATRGVAYGFVAVILASYLQALGADAATIGAVLGLALGSGAALSLVAGRFADRFGRRRFLALMGVSMFAAGLILAFTDSVAGAAAACAFGALSPTAMEVGPFLSVEQAVLPQVTRAARRADMFAWYNLVGNFAAAFGALLSGAAPAIGAAVGGDTVAGFHAMFLAYGVIGLAASAMALSLTRGVEAPASGAGPTRGRLGPEGRRTVRSLAALFAVDSFAGGMVIRTFVAFWLAVVFAPSVEVLGLVFFGANMLSGISFLVAARIARRLGLIRTMVYTHIPSNLLLMAFPFSPSFEVAAALYLARLSMAQMDVAPRQLFVVTVVRPDERTAAAAVTNTARSVAQAGGPFALGAIASATFLGAPFAVAGALKIAYDLVLLQRFGSVAADGWAHEDGGVDSAPANAGSPPPDL